MTITTPTQRSQSYSSPDTAAGPVALKPMPKTSTQPAAGQMGIPGVRAPGTPMSKDALDVWEFALFPKLSNALGQGFKNGINPDREPWLGTCTSGAPGPRLLRMRPRTGPQPSGVS